MYKQPLDYNKHFTIPFETLVQANNDNNPTNSNVSWKIDSIYLQSLDKIQRVHEIFYRHIRIFITRGGVVEIPIPKAIIKHIE